MNRKNEKGFTLVLSLVLLMAMSLMGGALIVISASDHQSNNVSDEYQQTFYVAETALYEGEKYLLNQFLGPYNTSGNRQATKRSLLSNNTAKFNPAGTPNLNPCYNSFQDIDRATFKSVKGPPPDRPLSTSFKDVKFHRVIPKGWFKPKDLEWNGNIDHPTTEEFLAKFDLQIKI